MIIMVQHMSNDLGGLFYRDVYPFIDVPRVAVVPDRFFEENLRKIYLTDTTLRDGQQGWRPFTVEECERIYELLVDIGRAVRSTEVFVYTEKDREVVKRLLSYGYEYPKVVGWIRATLSDLQLVIDSRLEEAVILASISDYHIKYKFNAPRDVVLNKYLDVVEKALSHGIVPRVSLEDITRADIEGVVIPFVKKLLNLSEKYGVTVKIKLPDTLGVGLPFYEVPLPRSIPRIVKAIRDAGVDPENIEFHAHNDLGLAVANQLAAWLYGAGGANCTLLGIGERAGNCPLEVMAVHYAGIKSSNDVNLKALPRILDLFEKMGYRTVDHYPIVGRNAFRTKAGIHVDGLMKNPEVYLPFDPMKVLGKPYSVAITPYSGRAAIVLWVRNYLGYNGISKDDPRVIAIYNDIVDYFNKTNRVEPLTDEEIANFVKKHMPELFKK
jgi:isopropylmalate/homocitrate/citramalate synthase